MSNFYKTVASKSIESFITLKQNMESKSNRQFRKNYHLNFQYIEFNQNYDFSLLDKCDIAKLKLVLQVMRGKEKKQR